MDNQPERETWKDALVTGVWVGFMRVLILSGGVTALVVWAHLFAAGFPSLNIYT